MKQESLPARKKAFIDTISGWGLHPDVVAAFREVDQALFFDRVFADKLYTEELLPTGYGEKSDNIYLMARMIDRLQPKRTMRILEIGTGSGFSTAILSLLCREVYTVEMDEKLAAMAKLRLYSNGYENIRFFAGDGTDPELEFGKLDAAVIWAGCYKRPLTVLSHLASGGTLVYPMGPEHLQQITVLKNEADPDRGLNFKVSFGEQGVFTPVKGRYGYHQIIDLGSEIFADVNDVDELPDENGNPS